MGRACDFVRDGVRGGGCVLFVLAAPCGSVARDDELERGRVWRGDCVEFVVLGAVGEEGVYGAGVGSRCGEGRGWWWGEEERRGGGCGEVSRCYARLESRVGGRGYGAWKCGVATQDPLQL